MELLELVLDELPELTVVLNHLGFWPTAFPPTSTAGLASTAPTRRRASSRRGLARFPRVFVLCTGMYAFAAGPSPYDDLRPVTRPARRVRARAAARLRLPVDPRRAGVRRDDRRGRRALAGPRRSRSRAVRGGNAMELFFV